MELETLPSLFPATTNERKRDGVKRRPAATAVRSSSSSSSAAVGAATPAIILEPMTTSSAMASSMRAERLRAHLTSNTLPVFLEVFAGSSRVTRALQEAGHAAVAVDIQRGEEHDCTDPGVLQTIEALVTEGHMKGVFLAPPCSSWSAARRGKPVGKMPKPVRNRRRMSNATPSLFPLEQTFRNIFLPT